MNVAAGLEATVDILDKDMLLMFVQCRFVINWTAMSSNYI